MICSIKRCAFALTLTLFSLGAYAQADPEVLVVVIPLGADEPAPAPPMEKVIFITKDGFNGDLGGLAGADDKCMADADAPGSKVKGKTFKAWLGPATDPLAGERDFRVYDLPYVTPNGDPYVSSYSTLLTMNPWPFISIGADGTPADAPDKFDDVWTGRDPTGGGS